VDELLTGGGGRNVERNFKELTKAVNVKTTVGRMRGLS
jgi:hypothetical protein